MPLGEADVSVGVREQGRDYLLIDVSDVLGQMTNSDSENKGNEIRVLQ